jgi:hypothetical protein
MQLQMKCSCLLIAALAAVPLSASTIDVASATFVTLHTGDELVFNLDLWNYAVDALVYGAPLLPASIGFNLVTEPLSSPVEFQAGLESTYGFTSTAFPGALQFQPGEFSGSSYSGPISTLSGSVTFADKWQELFLLRGGNVQLYLEDLGGDVTVGLDSYDMQHDLYATASGGPISVGAIPTSVTLRTAAGSSVPEPNSGLLFLGGGAVLCGVARLFKKVQPRLPQNIE